MAVNLYLLYCLNCGNKRFTDGSDISDLVEVKTCLSCGGPKKFKCPKCGHLIRTKRLRQDADKSDDSTNLR